MHFGTRGPACLIPRVMRSPFGAPSAAPEPAAQPTMLRLPLPGQPTPLRYILAGF